MKPLLAAKANLGTIRFPVMVSPKLDGIRCIIKDGEAVTRSLKPIKNTVIREKLSRLDFDGLDGEIMTYTDDKPDDFNTVQSKVMSADGDASDFTFWVFDDYKIAEGYQKRYIALYNRVLNIQGAEPVFGRSRPLALLRHDVALTLDALQDVILRHEGEGYEGTMVRRMDGPYKFGRSTENEGILLKIKKFLDDEALVIGVTELMRNENEAKINALGHTERSSHAENKVPGGIMGTLTVQWRDKVLDLGTGFTLAQRTEFWKEREHLIGKRVTFKYQDVSHLGVPRFPVFLGFREDL